MRGLTDRHTSNADPFLKNLKPYHQLHAPTDVKFTRSASPKALGHDIPKHVEVAVNFARFLLKLRHIDDVLEFSFGEPVLVFTTKPS